MDGLKKEIEKLLVSGLSEKTILMMVKDIYRELKSKKNVKVKDLDKSDK